jgi:hypothetical protein
LTVNPEACPDIDALTVVFAVNPETLTEEFVLDWAVALTSAPLFWDVKLDGDNEKESGVVSSVTETVTEFDTVGEVAAFDAEGLLLTVIE